MTILFRSYLVSSAVSASPAPHRRGSCHLRTHSFLGNYFLLIHHMIQRLNLRLLSHLIEKELSMAKLIFSVHSGTQRLRSFSGTLDILQNFILAKPSFHWVHHQLHMLSISAGQIPHSVASDSGSMAVKWVLVKFN